MNLTPQEIARRATDYNISGTAENLARLILWALHAEAQKNLELDEKEKA
ncbi:hypothetical protein QF001_000900 [Paraburkholderia youngii]